MNTFIRVCMITVGLLLGTTVTSQAQPSPVPRVWSMTVVEATRTDDAVAFRVIFSEPVSGVDVTDFATSGGNQHATVTAVTPSTTGDTVFVDVTLREPQVNLALILFDDDTIINTVAIPLGGAGPQNGNAISPAFSSTATAGSLNTEVSRVETTVPRSVDVDVGRNTSIALTSNNTPYITYYDSTNGHLKLAICNDMACLNPTISTIDSTGWTSAYSSIALTANNFPVISYYDASTAYLRLVICGDVNCTRTTNTVLDHMRTGMPSTINLSLALTTADIPIISYHDYANGDLKLAICTDVACSSPTISTIDSAGTVGSFSSLAITSDNIPIMSYHDFTNKALKLAVCNNTTCTNPAISVVDNGGLTGFRPSIELTNTNIPIISYNSIANSDLKQNYDLKLAVCNDTQCASPTLSTLDSDGDVGPDSSIKLTSTNFPVISYLDFTNATLKLAVCDDVACTNPAITILDNNGWVGYFTSLALTNSNVPIVSHFDVTNKKLKLYRPLDAAISIDLGQPNSFAKSSPTVGQSITAATTTLSWAASTYATSYAYCYALSIAACTTWTNAGSATMASISGLSHGATYHWQVRATNTSGTTLADNGTHGSFTVSLPPVSFAKSSPANNATKQKTSITLSWAASTYATSYEYCVALTTAACTTWKSTGTARTAAVTGLAKNKAYYWQVRAKNTAGTTLSSSTFWKFTTTP